MIEDRRDYLLTLAHTLAPELDQRPLYIVTAAEAGLTHSSVGSMGLVGAGVDLACREAIGSRWRGRGWCIMFRDFGDDAEGTLVHEVAHLVDGTMPWYEIKVAEEVAAGWVREGIQRSFTQSTPDRQSHHHAEFHRALIHLRQRALSAGLTLSWREVGPESFCPMWLLAGALEREVNRCRHLPFAQIMARPMPRRFRKLWNRRHLMAGRKDSPMTLMDIVRGLKARKEVAVEDYGSAVVRVAENGRVALESLERLLDATGKSPDDFAADVERLRRRSEAAATLRTGPDCNARRKEIAKRLTDAQAAFDRAETDFDVVFHQANADMDALRDQEKKIRECQNFLEETASPQTQARVLESEQIHRDALAAAAAAREQLDRASRNLRDAEARLENVRAGKVTQIRRHDYIGPEYTESEVQKQIEAAHSALDVAQRRCDDTQDAARHAEAQVASARKLLLIP